jgi:hypothetical protein
LILSQITPPQLIIDHTSSYFFKTLKPIGLKIKTNMMLLKTSYLVCPSIKIKEIFFNQRASDSKHPSNKISYSNSSFFYLFGSGVKLDHPLKITIFSAKFITTKFPIYSKRFFDYAKLTKSNLNKINYLLSKINFRLTFCSHPPLACYLISRKSTFCIPNVIYQGKLNFPSNSSKNNVKLLKRIFRRCWSVVTIGKSMLS